MDTGVLDARLRLMGRHLRRRFRSGRARRRLPGRPAEAGFGGLAARIGPGFTFLQTKPPAARSGQRLSGDAYVGPWIEGISSGRRQVLAVLGYRIGSVYAAAIAEGISRGQPMPKVILFD